MSMKKVGSIEVYELDENLDKYTRKEREEYINELFKLFSSAVISKIHWSLFLIHV